MSLLSSCREMVDAAVNDDWLIRNDRRSILKRAQSAITKATPKKDWLRLGLRTMINTVTTRCSTCGTGIRATEKVLPLGERVCPTCFKTGG